MSPTLLREFVDAKYAWWKTSFSNKNCKQIPSEFTPPIQCESTSVNNEKPSHLGKTIVVMYFTYQDKDVEIQG